jgi:hypothetical protein
LSEQLQIDWQAQRDAGIARAQAHADAVEPSWSETAYTMLERFCAARRGCQFQSSDVRRWCDLQGFKSPVPKAWGAPFKKAAKAGLIVRVGTAVAEHRHGSPAPLWGVV